MLGAFNCGGMNGTFSMAVDRLGFAWVMFNNPQGEIWKLDVTNVGVCTDPGYNQGQMGVNYFGMAFVSNSAEDVCDKLYGNTFNGFGGFAEGPNIGDFLTVDPDSLPLQARQDQLQRRRAHRHRRRPRVHVRRRQPGQARRGRQAPTASSSTSSRSRPRDLTNAFAFSFFAGDFYMFTESNNPNVSKVKVTLTTIVDYVDNRT
jgi:hypothetical protein